MRKIPLLIFIFAQQCPAGAQQVPDSLAHKSYAYLIERLEEDGSPAKAAAYAGAYLSKAKTEKNYAEMAGAYKALLHQSEAAVRSAYADSMVVAAGRAADTDALGSAWLTRGIVHYELKQYQQALDAYLEAAALIEKGNDAYLRQKLRFNMAQIKYYLGFYKEAEMLFSECVAHFQQEGGVAYLSSLHSLGLCYTSLKKYGLAAATNDLGLREAVHSGNESFVAYFTQAKGINLYFQREYEKALAMLEKSLPGIQKNRHAAAETMAYFYSAKCHLAVGDTLKAVPLLQKVDSAFASEDYIRPDLREAYEHLIAYYKKKKEIDKQLHYTNRLLHADSIIEKNFRYLSGKIHRHFNTKELLDSKSGLEKELRNQQRSTRLLAFILLLAAAVIVQLSVRNAKKKKIFETVMAEAEHLPAKKQEIREPKGEIGLSDEVVAALLQCLVKFESGKKFLEKDLTIAKLAASFNSNTKYVAKVILHRRGMRYIDYVNSLKIAYIVKLLKENRQARNFTLKALAGEAGFNTAQHFTSAFLKHVGISATYFIEKLKGGNE